jgi:ABC-type uncharacterized transport system substrate-binding protein
MILRRTFLAAVLALLVAALSANAQKKTARIAYMGNARPESGALFLNAFKEGLRDNGLIEGRDYTLDVLWAEGHYERFTAFAVELVQRNPDVIIATTAAAARAAQQVTRTIPIVLGSTNDPVAAGLVASLARPGGNTTGISNAAEDVTPKLVEIVRVLIPKAKVIAVLSNRSNPSNLPLLDYTRTSAAGFGLTVRSIEMSDPDELDALFTTLARQPPDALLVLPDGALNDHRDQIAALALKLRLPTITHLPEATDAGALIGYGPSRRANYRRAASYVKKILDGAKPGDLPVEQSARIELSINLRTAKALGITVPQSLLLRADEVIR